MPLLETLVLSYICAARLVMGWTAGPCLVYELSKQPRKSDDNRYIPMPLTNGPAQPDVQGDVGSIFALEHHLELLLDSGL
jgi:hypothetical protein